MTVATGSFSTSNIARFKSKHDYYSILILTKEQMLSLNVYCVTGHIVIVPKTMKTTKNSGDGNSSEILISLHPL